MSVHSFRSSESSEDGAGFPSLLSNARHPVNVPILTLHRQPSDASGYDIKHPYERKSIRTRQKSVSRIEPAPSRSCKAQVVERRREDKLKMVDNPGHHQRLNSGSMNQRSSTTEKRTICVCGASAFYERERMHLIREKERLREEKDRLKEQDRALQSKRANIQADMVELEKQKREAEKLQAEAMAAFSGVEREEAALEHAKRQVAKQRDQIAGDLQAVEDRQDIIGRETRELQALRQDLEEKAAALRKGLVKLDHEKQRYSHEEESLKRLRTDLESRESMLVNRESAAEERWRSMSAREGSLNEQLSLLEERRMSLNQKETKLHEREVIIERRELEIKRDQDALAMAKNELERRRREFEVYKKDEMAAISEERASMLQQQDVDKEDFESQVKLHKEWLAAEKETLSREQAAFRLESRQERDRALQEIQNLRLTQAESLKRERERLSQGQDELKQAQKQQEEALLEIRAEKAKLNYDREDLQKAIERLQNEKTEFNTQSSVTSENLMKMKLDLQRQSQAMTEEITQHRQRLQAMSADEGRIRQELDRLISLRKELAEAESHREVAMRAQNEHAKRLAELKRELEIKGNELKQREARLTEAEAQAAWMKDVFKSVKDAKEELRSQKEMLDWEKRQFEEGQRLLRSREKSLTRTVTPQKRQDRKREPSVQPLGQLHTLPISLSSRIQHKPTSTSDTADTVEAAAPKKKIEQDENISPSNQEESVYDYDGLDEQWKEEEQDESNRMWRGGSEAFPYSSPFRKDS